QEVGQEAVLEDPHLVCVETASQLHAVIADVTNGKRSVFPDLALNTEVPLLSVRRLQVVFGCEQGWRLRQRQLIEQIARHLERGNRRRHERHANNWSARAVSDSTAHGSIQRRNARG